MVVAVESASIVRRGGEEWVLFEARVWQVGSPDGTRDIRIGAIGIRGVTTWCLWEGVFQGNDLGWRG